MNVSEGLYEGGMFKRNCKDFISCVSMDPSEYVKVRLDDQIN